MEPRRLSSRKVSLHWLDYRFREGDQRLETDTDSDCSHGMGFAVA